MKKMIIVGGDVVNPAGESGALDILIEGGMILDMVPTAAHVSVGEDYERIDASGCIVAPGLVDTHVHFRDPGQTYKEDIITGAEAAKRGGFTTVVMMANTVPPIDNVETLKYVLEKGATTGINVKACANVTKEMMGESLTDMTALKEAGAVGFSDDGKPIVDSEVARDAMQKAAELDMPISFHEENPDFVKTPGFNRGRASQYFEIGGADRAAESTMIRRDIDLAIETGAKIIIQHISTSNGVDLVRRAKAVGVDIHAEATPHHFTLTEKDAIRYGTMAKMNPPLRTEEDRAAIIEGLRDGVIDMIATDHAPHTVEEKLKGITKAPSGIIGLETALKLGITELVRPGKLSMEQLITRMSVTPAEVYGLNAGALRIGGPADIVAFRQYRHEKVEDKFASKSKNSPFIGWELFGRIWYTIAAGEVVYRFDFEV